LTITGDPSESAGSVDPWAMVIGQTDAVRRLRSATESPVHAYLFVGPAGTGKRTAAAVFAGELLAAADPSSAERHRRLAARMEHPDVTVVTPTGNQFRRPESMELIRLASMAPVEGDLKVVVAVRFHDAEDPAMPPLLKIVEDPPGSTVFVFLADEIRPEHATIASRCVRIDFSPVEAGVLESALVSEGVEAVTARAAAASAGGRIERARRLAHDPQVESRRRAWHSIPDRLDGTGAAVATLVEEVRGLIDDAMAAIREIHATELAAMEKREEQFGTRGSGRRDLVEHHRRVERQIRTEELRFGLASVASRYRELLVAGGHVVGPMDAIGRLRVAADALVRNPNEALLLQGLLLDLPPASAVIGP
jgi:DNA polymerase-3 subunit delta'